MTYRIRFFAFLALGLLLIAPPILFGKDLEDRKWIEVRTQNFRIHSLMNEKRSIDLARDLETFRVVASIVTNTDLLDASVPTEIYALTGVNVSKNFGVSRNIAGFFRPGLRRNIIVIRDTFSMDGAAIILHEYVHFLIRNKSSLNYPTWFDEGFAEYLSSTEIESGVVTIGGVPKHRIASFKHSAWIPMRRLLSLMGHENMNPERAAMFYAEAWGLVHYLQNRTDSDRPFGQELKHYTMLLESGTDAVEAFEEAFAITVRDLDKNVKRYVRGNRIPGIRFSIDDLLTDFNPEVNVLTREQISLALGQIALQSDKLDNANHWFTVAATDDLYRPRAESGLGDVRKFRGEYDDAEPYFERAVALAPSDPYCHLDFAEYWHDRAEDTEQKESQAEYLAKARKYCVNAWKIDASIPEVYAMYGKTFLIGNEDFDKAIEMLEQAERLLPSSITVRASLAEAYLGANRLGAAERTARSVLVWSHGESDTAKRAREILESVTERREQNQDES